MTHWQLLLDDAVYTVLFMYMSASSQTQHATSTASTVNGFYLCTYPQIKRTRDIKRAIELPRGCVKLSYGGDFFEVTTFRGMVHAADIESAAADAGRNRSCPWCL